ncbi:MAG: hypothetical protein AB7O52_00110 [Planctomycetota bacterium]
MTFSTRPIIDLVKQNFVAVWESAAPVTVATFDLGDGQELQGTVGGEIALYFCRPDGMVFDILPALQAPATTRRAIEDALAFYRTTGATPEAVAAYHEAKRLAGSEFDGLTWRDFPHKQHLEYRLEGSDEGTRALSEMALSKVAMTAPTETVLVVEPGGRELYEHRLHERFAARHQLTAVDDWKTFVFEEVLGQRLDGGQFLFDSTSLAPLSVTR